MGLLFDREPVEALEDGLMCSGYWSGALQRSKCVSELLRGGGGKTRQVTNLGIKVPSAGKEGDGRR